MISFQFIGNRLQLGDQRQPQHVALARQQLTSMVFGKHLAHHDTLPNIFGDLLPFYFPIWILDSSS